MSLQKEVIEIIVEQLGVEESQVRPEVSFC